MEGRPDFDLGIVLKPYLHPLSHGILPGLGLIQRLRLLDRGFQFFLDLCLGSAQHILVDGLARLRVVPSCVSALPAATQRLTWANSGVPAAAVFFFASCTNFQHACHSAVLLLVRNQNKILRTIWNMALGCSLETTQCHIFSLKNPAQNSSSPISRSRRSTSVPSCTRLKIYSISGYRNRSLSTKGTFFRTKSRTLAKEGEGSSGFKKSMA